MKPSEKIKANLFLIQDGCYLSKDDIRFWKKIFSVQPNNYKAMYNVGLEIEQEAKEHLELYKRTQKSSQHRLYKSKMHKAYYLIKRSFTEGCYALAHRDMLRLRDEVALFNKQSVANTKTKAKKPLIFKTLVILLLLCLLFVSLLNLFKIPLFSITQSTFALLIPYKVCHEIPANILNANYLTTNIDVKPGIEDQTLVNDLMNQLKELYQRNSQSPLMVNAIDKNTHDVVGCAILGRENQNAEVYIYPKQNVRQELLWESTTVIRSALYQYIERNGHMPNNLDELTQPFPNNYLTSLPKEPYTLKNTVVSQNDGTGGWAYTPSNNSASGIKMLVQNSLKPNVKSAQQIPFEPISIYIDKANNTLMTVSGSTLLKKYPVALGIADSTPYGNFYLNKKIVNPDKSVPLSQNVFGDRAMELSDNSYAIHSTNDVSSIGKNVSMGCIRLSPCDAEDLYSYVPLYTPVNIGENNTDSFSTNDSGINNGLNPKLQTNSPDNEDAQNPGISSEMSPSTGNGRGGLNGTDLKQQLQSQMYDKNGSSKEEDNSTFYHWDF